MDTQLDLSIAATIKDPDLRASLERLGAVMKDTPAYSTDFCHPVHGNVAMQSMGMLPPTPEDFCHPVHGNVATLGA